MNLLPAGQFSIEELTEAYNQTRIDYLVPMPMTPRRLQDYIHDYDVDLSASAVAVEDDHIIGLCMLGLRGRDGWITRLGVLPGSRKQHAGLRLMEYCLDQAARRQVEDIFLEVIVGNTPAHNLFTGLGFHEIRKLLVLRRPPGLPPAEPDNPTYQAALSDAAEVEWLDHERALLLAADRPERPAWTNRTETVANAPALQALHIARLSGGGWVSYEVTPLQLRRVIVGADRETGMAPAYALLHTLHTRFPLLDTIAENVPADSADLSAMYAHGYVVSFVRIEMMRSLAG